MRAVLVVEEGPAKGRTISLRGSKTLIGRGHDCDLQVLDESLSRVHCLLEKKGEQFFLTDLNSRNGTFLDGSRVKSAVVSPGSVVSVGDTHLRLKKIEMATTGAPSPQVVTDAGKASEKIESRLDPSKTPLIAASHKDLVKSESSRLQRDLATIYKIGSLISSENDLTLLCDLIMDSILDVIDVDRGFLLLGNSVESAHAVVVRGAEGEGDSELTLSSTILAESLEKGMAVMSSDAMDDDRFRGEDSIVMHNITSVMCVPLEAEGDILGAIYVDTIGSSAAFATADLELLSAIGRQAGVAIERARLMEDLENLFYDSVSTLVATIEANDPYTKGHSDRVTSLAVGIGDSMDVGPEMIATIRLAGLLHDIGKVGIPGEVLNKKDPLTDEEWETIKTHPVMGAGIISNIRRMKDVVVSGVRHHHERWNGDGYPDGLRGKEIPMISRILSVADAFDAMTSQRPYRDFVRSSEEAIQELREQAGEQFDSRVVEAFINSYAASVLKTVDGSGTIDEVDEMDEAEVS